ncbi:MAG: hypothetical protein ACK4S6_16255 [Roseateles asaccharophilus]|uniref:hypothetical protein n=1 Tax=Roseateles asaccharophilus TaxID=582607 RepID=UPI0039191F74
MRVEPTQDRARALALLELAAAHDVSGPSSAAELAEGAALFDLVRDGQAVGAFALRVDRYPSGTVMTVTAAASQAGQDATACMDAWLVDQARRHVGARAITCQTRRPGLVRKLQRAGWRVAGFVMQKDT